MSTVFVLDNSKVPLQPCHPAKAWQLLRDGKTAVFGRYSFTIILKREMSNVSTSSVPKVGPASRAISSAIIDDESGKVAFAVGLNHGGQRCGTDEYGFPIRHAHRAESFMGFQTGDMVRAKSMQGSIQDDSDRAFLNGFDVHPKCLTALHRSDGYAYEVDYPHD